AGTRGDRRDADLARVAARPRIRGVHCGLLVAHVDDADALLLAARVERHDVAAAESEDALDAGRLEGATRENAAVDVGHGGYLVARKFRAASRQASEDQRVGKERSTVSPRRRCGQMN